MKSVNDMNLEQCLSSCNTTKQYESLSKISQSNDGWIEWHGGECPVPKGKLVDVKYRSGHTKCSMPALEDAGDESGIDANSCFWFHDSHKCDIIAYRLHQPEQQAWNGEGLPPVGTECEHCPGGTTQHDWEIVTVLGISERPGGVFTDYWLRKEDGCSYVIGNPYRFRPIRTEAERKRDGFIDQLMADWAFLGQDREQAGNLYDAIAAGNIRGVKLEG